VKGRPETKLNRLDLTNVSSFNFTVRATESYITVGVNLRDREGTNPYRSELGIGSVIAGHDEVINFVIMGDARGIGSKEALVNLELTRVLKSKEVSDKRNVNKHVTAEGERAWGWTV